MDYALQIQKLLLQRNKVSSPDDKITLLKQAINLADVHNDVEWGVDLRLNLIRDEKDTSRCDESLPAFTWILEAYDRNPETFDEEDFLWEYKWMLGSVRRNSLISMEQIDSIAEDFKTRLLRNGYSLRPYYTVKAHMAFFLGDLDDAKEYIDLRNKEVRDEMSNCRACELDDDVELELRLGNFEKALTVGNIMLTKKITCGHMPFSCYCTCVEYFQKAGNMEKAYEYFQKAEADLAELDDTSQVSEVGILIRFLTDYDKDKAWSFFEQHAHWNVNSEDYLDFLFSINVLPLFKGEGNKIININPSLSWYKEDNSYNLQEVYNYYYERAKDLADRFDQRNGNKYFNKQLAEAIIITEKN
jgi:tetratricopeptide (TPR) repeat protein